MMAVRPMGVFLLVLLAAVVSAKGFCPGNGTWHYHDPTRTCMSLRTEKSTYADADKLCKGFLGSIDRKTPGHLVYIFDKATDDFVKGLLDKDSDMEALIGLYYHSRSGYHKWGGNKYLGYQSYKNWATGEWFNDSEKSSVVITKSGWKTHSQDTETEFVCQVEIAVGSPTINCPPAEVGQPGSITCTIELPNDQPLSPELRIKSNEQVELSCTSCWKDSVETGAISRSWPSRNKTVQRSDEGDKICSVKFEDGPELTSIPCHLEVYSLPSKVECEVNYIQTTMNVTCTSTRMYPKPDCQWDWTTTSQTTGYIEDTYNDLQYYQAVCRRTFTLPVAGTYLFEVSVYPSVSDRTHLSSVTRGSLKVVVEAPNLPELYDSQWASITSELEVKENQTVTINCQIWGGKPEVYRTFINCYPHPHQEVSGRQVSVTFSVTQSFHNQNCRCQGYHLTGLTRDVSLKLLVLSAPRITSFTFYGSQHQVHFKKNDTLSLRCESTGHPQPRLSLLYYQDTLMTPVIGSYYVTKRVTATCNSMGNYTCLAENNALQKDVKHVQLKVRCAPEYCLGTEQLPKHGAAVNSNAVVQMCVHVYPAPTYFWLYKGIGYGRIEVPRSRFEVNFTYTDEETGQGTITVTILSVRQEDFGGYQLTSRSRQSGFTDLYSTLDFELVARGPPSCPEKLTVSSTYPDSITLSWRPGFDGGLQQSFTILRYDSGLTTEPHIVAEIPQPERNLEDLMSYNVTGLSGSSTYTFGLRAKNGVGTSSCTLQVQGSTEASPLSSADGNVISIAVPVVLCLILVIIVVVVVAVLVRRRRSRGVTASDVAQSLKANKTISNRNDRQDCSNANTIVGNRPSGQGISKVNNLTTGTTDDTGQDNTYALVIKENIKKTQEPKDKNIFRRDSDESKPDNTYALVRKPNNKKGKEKPIESNRIEKDTVGQQQEATYAQVAKDSNKKGKKQKRSQIEEDGHGAVVYSNMSNYIETTPAQETAVNDSVYANMASSSKTGNEEESPVTYDGRTVTEDGLIYTEVTINVKTSYPEIKSKARSKVTVVPTQPVEPSVEYVALDFVATGKQKL